MAECGSGRASPAMVSAGADSITAGSSSPCLPARQARAATTSSRPLFRECFLFDRGRKELGRRGRPLRIRLIEHEFDTGGAAGIGNGRIPIDTPGDDTFHAAHRPFLEAVIAGRIGGVDGRILSRNAAQGRGLEGAVLFRMNGTDAVTLLEQVDRKS